MLTLVLFLLALGVLVFIHELGHFLPAKLFGMRVEKFYLFFDWPRKLYSFKRGGTEYGIGLLPLGGYVKIAGMVDESSLKEKRDLSAPPAPDEFRAKPLYQRALVIAGGPLANAFYAYVVFFLILLIGGRERLAYHEWAMGLEAVPLLGIQEGDQMLAVNDQPAYADVLLSPEWLTRDAPTITLLRAGQPLTVTLTPSVRDTLLRWLLQKREVFELRLPAVVDPAPGGPADQAGLQSGDTILMLNDTPVSSFQHLRRLLQAVPADTVQLLLGTSTGRMSKSVRLDSLKRLQVRPKVQLPTHIQKLSVLQALGAGTDLLIRSTSLQLKGFMLLLTGRLRPSESLSGPIGIAQMTARQFEEGGWVQLITFSALLSLILAIMNLLPIPLLDGGHLVFLGLEAILRREPSQKVREVAQYVGLAIIVLLMVFALWNDLKRL